MSKPPAIKQSWNAAQMVVLTDILAGYGDAVIDWRVVAETFLEKTGIRRSPGGMKQHWKRNGPDEAGLVRWHPRKNTGGWAVGTPPGDPDGPADPLHHALAPAAYNSLPSVDIVRVTDDHGAHPEPAPSAADPGEARDRDLGKVVSPVTARRATDRTIVRHFLNPADCSKALNLPLDLVRDAAGPTATTAVGEWLISSYLQPPSPSNADPPTSPPQPRAAPGEEPVVMSRADDPAVWLEFPSAGNAARAIRATAANLMAVLDRPKASIRGWRAYRRQTAIGHSSFGRIEPSGGWHKHAPSPETRGPAAQWHGSRRVAILTDPVANERLYFDSSVQAAMYVALSASAFAQARDTGQVVGGRWYVEDASAAQVRAATSAPLKPAQDGSAYTRPDPCPSCNRQFETKPELARHESNLLLYCPQYGGTATAEVESLVVAASEAAARMLAFADEANHVCEETGVKASAAQSKQTAKQTKSSGDRACPTVLYDPVTRAHLKFTSGKKAAKFLNMTLAAFSNARNTGELTADRWQILDAVPVLGMGEQPTPMLGPPVAAVSKRVATTSHRVTSKSRRLEIHGLVLFDPLAKERHQFSSDGAAAAFLRMPETVFAESRKSVSKRTGRWLIQDVQRSAVERGYAEPDAPMDPAFPSMDGGHSGLRNPSLGSTLHAAEPARAPREGHAVAPHSDIGHGSPAHASQEEHVAAPHIHHYGGPHQHLGRRHRRLASTTDALRQVKKPSQAARGAKFAPMLDGITMKLLGQPPADQPQVRMSRVIVRRKTAKILRAISSEVGSEGFLSKALQVDLGSKLLFVRQVEDTPFGRSNAEVR